MAKRVIIVDDDVALIKLLTHTLEERTFEVLAEADGLQGIKTIAAEYESLDLIVLDVMMPGMSGLEIFKKISAIKVERRVPILIITGRSELLDFFEQVDVAGFIPKPIDKDVFIKEVFRIIENKPLPVAFIIDTADNTRMKSFNIMLRQEGYKAMFLENYDAVFEASKKFQPVCVLLAYEQKDIAGKELIKKIKDLPSKLPKMTWPFNFIPTVIVYTNSDKNYYDDSVESGADYYIGKPENDKALMDKFHEAIVKIKKDREMEMMKKQQSRGSTPSASDFRGAFG